MYNVEIVNLTDGLVFYAQLTSTFGLYEVGFHLSVDVQMSY